MWWQLLANLIGTGAGLAASRTARQEGEEASRELMEDQAAMQPVTLDGLGLSDDIMGNLTGTLTQPEKPGVTMKDLLADMNKGGGLT